MFFFWGGGGGAEGDVHFNRLATKFKSLRKFSLRLLVTASESVWPGFNITGNVSC